MSALPSKAIALLWHSGSNIRGPDGVDPDVAASMTAMSAWMWASTMLLWREGLQEPRSCLESAALVAADAPLETDSEARRAAGAALRPSAERPSP